MRLPKLATVFLVAAYVTVPGVMAQQQQTRTPIIPPDKDYNDSDPDMPAFVAGKRHLDMKTYLRLRGEHIAKLRGLPYPTPYDPRARALGLMEQQMRSTMPQIMINNTSWTELGPSPIPNGQTNGASVPVSGRVTAIAVHPSNPDIAYVGTAGGGLYRTLNGGASWTELFDQAQTLAIGAIVIDPLNTTTVFVGTGESNQSIDSYWGVGLYVIRNAETTPALSGPFSTRTNGGNGIALYGNAVSAMFMDPTNDNILWIATASGNSADGGQGGVYNPASVGLYYCNNAQAATPTFALVTNLNVGNITDIVAEPGAPGNLLIGLNASSYNSGIYRSTNGGSGTASTWTRTLALNPMNIRLAINKTGSAVTVYAVTEESSGHLRQSTDGGQSWPTNLPAPDGFCGKQCWYDLCVAVDRNNANTVYLGGSAPGAPAAILKKSTDGGATFSNIDLLLHADAHAIAIAPSNSSIIYFGCDGGIWRTNNAGGNWSSINTAGFNATQFQSIAVHPSDANFSIGGTQDNGTPWYQSGGTWTRADWGDGGYALIDQNAPDITNVTMYHTYFNTNDPSGPQIGYAKVTTTANAHDAGWAFYGCGGTANGMNCTDQVLFYAPMALGPGNPNTLYFGTTRLWRSTDAGVTMSTASQAPLGPGYRLSTIAISPQNDNVRIVGTEIGQVWATTTGSTTLTNVTAAGFPQRYVGRVTIDPNNSNTAYVAFAGYGLNSGTSVWRTTNLAGGAGTWTPDGGSGLNRLPDVPVNALVVDPANSNYLYAGTDIGVYRSTNAGTDWFPFSNGLPRVAVFDMAIQNSNRILRIATHGRGFWEISIGCYISCPANITQNTDPNVCYAVVNYPPPTVQGSCGTVTCSPAAGSQFPKGVTTVTCNTGVGLSCSFTVTVIDAQPPSISCPANIYLESDATCNGLTVNYPPPTVSDNCPGVTWSCVPPSGYYFPAGHPIQVTPVTCTATDASANTAACGFTVTIEQRPIITLASSAAVFGFGCKLSTPQTKSILITNTGGHYAGGVLAWTASTSAAEITLVNPTGVENQALQITVDPTGLAYGTYTRSITITGKNSVSNSPACNSPQIIAVTIQIEPPLPVTQTLAVGSSWTQFTNSVGQPIADIRSNGGPIPSFTVSMTPCTYPNGMTRLRYIKRYYNFTSSVRPLNIDMRLYYNGAEAAGVPQPNLLQIYQQPVYAGAWTSWGGTSNSFLNQVVATGVTSVDGTFAEATIWTPKPAQFDLLSATWDAKNRSVLVRWATPLQADEEGFQVERTLNEANGPWERIGAVPADASGSYRFNDSPDADGKYFYRIFVLEQDGSAYESATVSVNAFAAPAEFSLDQNYPNPFNPSTVITYRIPSASRIVLKVFDVHMRLVATLVDEEKGAGQYDVAFDAKNLPSGAYMYQLEALGQSGARLYAQMRKMTLLK